MVELDCSLPCSVVGFVPFPQHFFLYVGFNGFSACGFVLVFAHGSLNLVFFSVSCIALPGSSFKECQIISEHSLFCFHFFAVFRLLGVHHSK